MSRIGFGYDSHRLVPGRPLLLAGVRIEHSHGLAGHSDADAALHAVTDAILGALAAGDIGELFPQNDAQWAGADSAVFVRHAMGLAGARGLRVANCDLTILADRPTLSNHKNAMRSNLADLLHVGEDAISVKAKTNEGMGFVGRGEGIAALAAVMLTEE